MKNFYFQIYRFLIFPLAWLIFETGSAFGGQKWKALKAAKTAGLMPKGRFSLEEIRNRRPIWVHASSGEIEYARPVIRRLKETHPEIPVVVTYGSPSAIRILEKMSEVDAWGAVPWEFRGNIEKFIDSVQPRAVLIARTDVWPVMIDSVARRKIPSLLFAATFARNSSRLKGWMRPLTAFTLERLDAIQVVSTEDARALEGLTATEKIVVTGDTRYDQVLHRLAHPAKVPESLKPAQGPVFVAGSTWPEDEAHLLPAIERHPEWKVLLAPHEVSPARLSQLEKDLRTRGISVQRFSQSSVWEDRVLLLDRIGILAELYAWADLAFVGGSFRKQVHSVMEPLAAGARVLVGPRHVNNREAIELQRIPVGAHPAVCVVSDTTALEKALSDPSYRSDREAIRELIRQRQGATTQVLKWVENRA